MTALATVQTRLGHDLRNLQLVFEDFEELIDELDEAAAAICDEVNVESVIIKVFYDDYSIRASPRRKPPNLNQRKNSAK